MMLRGAPVNITRDPTRCLPVRFYNALTFCSSWVFYALAALESELRIATDGSVHSLIRGVQCQPGFRVACMCAYAEVPAYRRGKNLDVARRVARLRADAEEAMLGRVE
jgi:hypothetical protein